MMYAPAPDTFLLARCAQKYRGSWALEIGVGSGAVADSLAGNFDSVAGTDIDFESLSYAKGRNRELMLVCCDSASALAEVKFDLIVTNPPYLPDDEKKDVTVHGGPTGVETTMRFIESAIPLLSPRGAILIVVSSRSDQTVLDTFLKEKGLKKRVVGEKKLFFELLSVFELTF
jgi:release factor glutamine methyltransferase